MGNNDGFESIIKGYNKNKVEYFEGGYFSFAFCDEIALVLNGKFYILNCDGVLWEEVKNEIFKTKGNKEELIKYWLEQSKTYEINSWSNDFEELK